MQKAAGWFACTIVVILQFTLPVGAQSDETHPTERLNSNAAVMISIPVGQTAQYATTAWGFAYGAGYNFSKHHAIIGEIMWNSLYPTSAALAPFQSMFQNNIRGHGNLVALTANYRLQLSGKVYGPYVIAGAGMYYRQASLSQTVATGESVTCTPAWLWWGFTCSSGVVTNDQLLGSSSSTAPGGNIGLGLTIAIPDSKYRLYIESRYHYAANKGVATRLVPIAIGVRF